MSQSEEKGFWKQLGDDLGFDTEGIERDYEAIKDGVAADFNQLAEDLVQTVDEGVEKLDKAAGKAAIKSKIFYDKHEVEKRMIGAGAGAKAGFVVGLKGGPVAIKFCMAAGAVAGGIMGPEGVDKFTKWRDGHEGAGNDNDAAKPKSPTDDIAPK